MVGIAVCKICMSMHQIKKTPVVDISTFLAQPEMHWHTNSGDIVCNCLILQARMCGALMLWGHQGHMIPGYLRASSQTFERRADSRARRNLFPFSRPHAHAMSTHLPIRALRPLHQQCIFRRVESRPFSTTLARPATRRKRSVDPAQTAAAVRYQIQGAKASSVVYEEQLKDDNNLPDDIGLLPGIYACWLRDLFLLIQDGRNLHPQADIPPRALCVINRTAYLLQDISTRSLSHCWKQDLVLPKVVGTAHV
jgi:hypothetical protein